MVNNINFMKDNNLFVLSIIPSDINTVFEKSKHFPKSCARAQKYLQPEFQFHASVRQFILTPRMHKRD